MISDAEVFPIQEINYLRNFTSEEPQRLVDNYRKRQQQNPSALLKDLWAELERRFGSPAVITNALLERMHKTASFGENENTKPQDFADLCADVESQVAHLPGLQCLTFPNAVQPIAEKLPSSQRGKWKKEIAKYSQRNAGAYPGFAVFSTVIQYQARTKNNPNILIGAKLTPVGTPAPSRRVQNRRTLATNTQPSSMNPRPSLREVEATVKRCPFHDRAGHSLEAFAAKSLEEKTEWVSKANLCLRCFSGEHQASSCKRQIKCSTCGDSCHPALLHKEKWPTTTRSDDTVNTRCTSACNANGVGVSCSKIVLVDVHSKRIPSATQRVYAIIDEQSNSSLISSELADELGAKGPLEKYYLSTCSSNREMKHGRRVTGTTIRALNGTALDLLTLIECNSIRRDPAIQR
ncbi:uncharacterized protein [Montipora capricornis]|uniref:uncharacterized protein n=1 Tax=Montipora capricornis TaxID=246305 RepID=UPI0035F11EEE